VRSRQEIHRRPLRRLAIDGDFRYNPDMGRKSIKVIPKKRGRGRPATGKDPLVGFRLPKAEIASLDKWAKAKGYTRSEAIRRLIREIKHK
jgi:hypothetical protein